ATPSAVTISTSESRSSVMWYRNADSPPAASASPATGNSTTWVVVPSTSSTRSCEASSAISSASAAFSALISSNRYVKVSTGPKSSESAASESSYASQPSAGGDSGSSPSSAGTLARPPGPASSNRCPSASSTFTYAVMVRQSIRPCPLTTSPSARGTVISTVADSAQFADLTWAIVFANSPS